MFLWASSFLRTTLHAIKRCNSKTTTVRSSKRRARAVFFYTHKISLLMKIPEGRTYANTLRGLRARGLRPSTPKCEMHKGCRG